MPINIGGKINSIVKMLRQYFPDNRPCTGFFLLEKVEDKTVEEAIQKRIIVSYDKENVPFDSKKFYISDAGRRLRDN